MDRLDRPELADFLRRGRARLNPVDVGLEPGSRRRTPGLRREEVARLAGMSADYYTRLEQRRGPRPSRQMLRALARALRLTGDERDHLFHLAGEAPPREHREPGHVRPGLLLLLDRLYDTPARVITDYGDVLAQNRMAELLSGHAYGRPAGVHNLIRGYFLDPGARLLFPEEDRAEHARAHVANLRAVAAARPDDPAPAALVAELLATSGEFRALWRTHEVARRRVDTKRFLHPVVGLLELDCETLVGSDPCQHLLIHSARPGTPAHEALALLRVVGHQSMTADERPDGPHR
ncbi:helix-turn-helix transcriptional regulator [Streptomyces sp. NPDC050560]|uniref:helix-turn-helix transcriptional regulator n=1 Tax=Streptomyces sp. NPDC050560 TaxID=3365630 RepID=UPI0037B9EFFC